MTDDRALKVKLMCSYVPHPQSDDECEISADWLAAFHLRILPTEVFTVYTVATM